VSGRLRGGRGRGRDFSSERGGAVVPPHDPQRCDDGEGDLVLLRLRRSWRAREGARQWARRGRGPRLLDELLLFLCCGNGKKEDGGVVHVRR